MIYTGYIYLTINQQTNKIYVGQKIGTPEQTINYLGSGTKFLEAINLYGKYFFKKIIIGCLFAKTKKELKKLLDEAETECIYFYRAYGSDGKNYDETYGYNLAKKASSVLGSKRSKETKKFISEITTNLWKDESYRQKQMIINNMPETKKKKSEKQKGIPKSKEHSHNVSLGMKSRWQDKEYRKQQTIALQQAHNLPENRKKNSESKKGRIPWNKGLKGAQVAWNKGLKKENK